MSKSAIFEQGFSGGIETLVKGAEEERALIARSQTATAGEVPVVDSRQAEIDATRAYLTEALALAHKKYTEASPMLRNELCIVEQAIDNTLTRIKSLFYGE